MTDEPNTPDPAARQPMISFVSGRPSEEEVAAVTAVVLSLASTSGTAERTTSGSPNGWGAHWRRVRPSFTRGADAWRMSAR